MIDLWGTSDVNHWMDEKRILVHRDSLSIVTTTGVHCWCYSSLLLLHKINLKRNAAHSK